MATFTVTTTADTGLGSLRQALTDAKALGGADTIIFDAALNGGTINLATALTVNSSVTIQGLGAAKLTISGGNTTGIFLVENNGSATPETVAISGLTLTGGRAPNGGAVSMFGENLTLDRVAITGNAATDAFSGGGGVFASPGAGALTITNSSITGNTSANAGGGMVVLNSGTGVLIQNTTIANNSSTNEGGGINGQSATISILNSTIVGNSSGNFGGGIRASGAVTIRNSILAGNTAPSGPDYSLGGTVADSYNLISNAAGAGAFGTGTGSVISAANLAALTFVDGIGVLLPNAGSAAIDAGDPAYTSATTPTTDARGFVRVVGGRIDMGAAEFGSALPVVAPPPGGITTAPAPPPTVAPTVGVNFTNVVGNPGFGAGAVPPTVTTPAGQVLPNPLLEQQKAVAALIAKVDAGQMSLKAAQDVIVDMADGTTSVASMSYQFFTGHLPTKAGLDYLVSSPQNPADLNDGYYAGMSLENRYINFAVNLGKLGEGAAKFTTDYGSLSLSDATAKAYALIFGSVPTAQKLADILTPERTAYLGALGGDALGQKAAMVGFLLGEAAKADLGPYAVQNENFLYDLLDGVAAFGADAHIYLGAGPTTVGLVGVA